MSLLRKELRALRPFLWFILVFAGLGLFTTAATKFPDQHSLADIFTDFDATFGYLFLLALAFAMGQTLILRERAEETLEFLDSLPLARSRVYWTKWLAGYLALAAYLLIELGLNLPLHLWSRTSDNPSAHADFWLPMLAMDLGVVAIYLSAGMALAFWGRFGLLAAAFYLIGIWILKELGWPAAERLDPLAFARFEVTGSELHIPWRLLLPQLAAAAGLAWAGQLAFASLGKGQESAAAWRRALAPLFVLGLVAAAGTWFVAAVFFEGEEAAAEAQGEGDPTYLEWETTRLSTKRFIFIYPNSLAARAEELAAGADAVHDTVAGFLGAEPRRQLVVDLTSRSPRHAGSAYWGRIRMNLQAEGLEARLPAVLGHELCHIYIDQLSEHRVADKFDATRFFHEGLASLVEYRFFRPPGETDQIRRNAAWARDRLDIRFEDLCSSAALSRRHAPEWVYPLGEAFAAALVETRGDEAPGDLVRAFARPGAPSGLGGVALWQDTFQAAGHDLESAIAAFFQLLDRVAAEHRGWLDALPRLRGELVRDGNRVGVRVLPADGDSSLPPRRQIQVRFRAGPGAPESEYRTRRLSADGAAWISRDQFPGGALDFQILHLPAEETMMPLFGPWVSARVPPH